MTTKKTKSPEEVLKDMESKIKKSDNSETYMDHKDEEKALESWEEEIRD